MKDWNVEKAAYAAIGLLAAALRLFQLGLRPLGEGEAAQALAAFRFSQGAASAAPAGTVPALFAGNVLGFSLMGANDLTARWLPALAGLILVLLPYGLRRQLGRGGALAASLLLALSPTAIYFSRNLDGAILVAACGLALIVGLVNYLDTWRPAFLYLSAVALGLGLTAGSGIYAWLLIVAAFGLLLYAGSRFLHRDWGWSALAGGWLAARAEAGLPVRLGATLAASFGLVATVFALYPGGMGHAADLLAAWLTGFAPGHNPQPYIYPWLLLLRYEPLILALGLIEMGRWLVSRTIHRPKTKTPLAPDHSPAPKRWAATRREQEMGRPPGVGSNRRLDSTPAPARTGQGRRVSDPAGATAGLDRVALDEDTPWTPFWVFWAAVALLLLPLSGQRAAGNTLLAVTPLALLAGQGVARAWRWISRRALWAEAGLMAGAALVLGGFFYLQLAAYSQAVGSIPLELLGTDLPTATSYLLLAGAAVLLLLGLGVIAWMWRSPELIVAGGWLALVVALGAFGFKAAWSLNVAHAADARELMAGGWATAPDVRALVDHLEALSLEKSGDAHTLPLTVAADTGPVTAWYLRRFEQQTVVDALDSPPDTVAAVTLAAQDLPIGETFRGHGYPLRTRWLPWGLWGQPLVRWLLFTEGDLPTVDRELVLWVAGDAGSPPEKSGLP